jgi:transcriptional regulator with XRE-family HTH domain
MSGMINQNEIHRYVTKKIEEARLLAGYNKVEMARRLGMVKSAYQKLEDGTQKFIDISQLFRIADVTGRKVVFFLPEDTAGGISTDAATALQREYNVDTASLGEILDFAQLVAERDRRVRSVGNQAREESDGDTPRSNKAQE